MQVRVGPDAIDVIDADVLTALSVATSLPVEEALRVMVTEGLARDPESPDGHAWLDVAELARRASPAADGSWRDGFDAMIAYAAGRGWTDADRTVVRAHVETDS